MRYFFLIVVALLLPSPIFAGQSNDEGGIGFDSRVDLQRVLRLTQESANRGDAKAEYQLGWMYLHGFDGLEKNPSEAIKWFERAATHGSPDAQDQLGFM